MKLQSTFLTMTTGSIVALFAASSWAVPTECVTVGIGTPTLKLAIAANFYVPAQAMAQDFIDSSSGSVNAVLVCQNSTAHLNQEILNGTELPAQLQPDPGFPRYDYFFAANTSTPQALQGATAHTAFLYAKGIPVLYSEPARNAAVTTVGDLITGLGSATHTSIGGTSLSGVSINSKALSVGVANPTAAPYGLAAKNITTAMGLAWAGNTPPSPPVHPTLFDNIDVTYDRVGQTVNGTFVGSAFVAKSQICPTLASARYVEFPGFALDQSAIQLNSAATSTAFDSYLKARLTSNWNGFLAANCYAGLTIPSVPLGAFAAPVIGGLLALLGVQRIRRGNHKPSAPPAA